MNRLRFRIIMATRRWPRVGTYRCNGMCFGRPWFHIWPRKRGEGHYFNVRAFGRIHLSLTLPSAQYVPASLW